MKFFSNPARRSDNIRAAQKAQTKFTESWADRIRSGVKIGNEFPNSFQRPFSRGDGGSKLGANSSRAASAMAEKKRGQDGKVFDAMEPSFQDGLTPGKAAASIDPAIAAGLVRFAHTGPARPPEEFLSQVNAVAPKPIRPLNDKIQFRQLVKSIRIVHFVWLGVAGLPWL